jgi:hypothetical protein
MENHGENPSNQDGDEPVELSIPDNAPTVSFDRQLGGKHTYIDFDYGEFQNEIQRIGLSTEDAQTLHIEIIPPKRHSYEGIYRFSYKTDENELEARDEEDHDSQENIEEIPNIEVALDHDVNEHLAHELKHAADHAEGLLKHDLRAKIGRVGLRANWIVVPSLAFAGASVAFSTNDVLSVPFAIANLVFTGVNIASGGAIIYGYISHPDEVRARRASKGALKVIKTA